MGAPHGRAGTNDDQHLLRVTRRAAPSKPLQPAQPWMTVMLGAMVVKKLSGSPVITSVLAAQSVRPPRMTSGSPAAFGPPATARASNAAMEFVCWPALQHLITNGRARVVIGGQAATNGEHRYVAGAL